MTRAIAGGGLVVAGVGRTQRRTVTAVAGACTGESTVPDRCAPVKISDGDAMARLQKWEAEALVIEESVVAAPARVLVVPSTSSSTSGTSTARSTPRGGVVLGLDTSRRDERRQQRAGSHRTGRRGRRHSRRRKISGPDVPSPMADLPTGAKFGTLVHAVLETTDPFATDLAAELETQIREHSVWWPVDVDPSELAAAMVPMHDTVGPVGSRGFTLRQIGLPDRLRELDFELAGGRRSTLAAPNIRLADVGVLLSQHLPADDALASYADRLTGDALGNQSLRGI